MLKFADRLKKDDVRQVKSLTAVLETYLTTMLTEGYEVKYPDDPWGDVEQILVAQKSLLHYLKVTFYNFMGIARFEIVQPYGKLGQSVEGTEAVKWRQTAGELVQRSGKRVAQWKSVRNPASTFQIPS